jgi:hypothetical protein
MSDARLDLVTILKRPWSILGTIRGIVIGVSLLVGMTIAYGAYEIRISAQADGKVSHTVTATGETWRIDEPNVKQRVTPYPQIKFQPGDKITIQAGGCVQTGGIGKTWKRYVNPTGPDADKLYHGLIWIPGVIGGRAATGVPPDPKRIVAYIGPNQSVTVPAGVDPAQLYLRLGYEDGQGDYGDNGYSDHDDGTQNQCKGVGNAFVSLTIVHGPPHQTNNENAPFDLVWTSEDDNGIPLNAKWGWQVTHPGAFPDPTQCTDGPFKSPCTNWFDVVTQDTAEICNLEQYEPGHSNSPPLYGVAGHVNWAAGTYVGKVMWESHSAPGTDDDYNLKFYPVGGAGLVSVRDNIEVEFDSDETIDHFNSPWWNTLHHAVDNNSDDQVNQMLFKEPNGTIGRYGIVTGLEGLEMCHNGSNELHPAWAVAIRVKDDDPSDEVWAMFVRRSGNEGYCSGNQHYLTDLPADSYTFRLPWRPGASSVNSTSKTTFLQTSGGASGPGIQWALNQGVLVSFTLPQPQGGNIIYGELHLQWPGGQGPAPIPNVGASTAARAGAARGVTSGRGTAARGATARGARGAAGAVGARGTVARGAAAHPLQDEPEKRVASALAKMPAAQRDPVLAASKRAAVTVHPQPLKQGAVKQIQSLPTHPPRPRKKQYQSATDAAKAQRNQAALAAFRKAIGR